MKKQLLVFLLVSLLVLTTASLALASGVPQLADGCPDGFHPHPALEHNHGGHGQHLHVGNDIDLNGDGSICGKHVSADGSVHVHIDNLIPLP